MVLFLVRSSHLILLARRMARATTHSALWSMADEGGHGRAGGLSNVSVGPRKGQCMQGARKDGSMKTASREGRANAPKGPGRTGE